jgi:hypothetical protein
VPGEEKEEKGGRGCGKSIKKAGKGPGGRYTYTMAKEATFLTNICVSTRITGLISHGRQV